jgi:hypothetical protein
MAVRPKPNYRGTVNGSLAAPGFVIAVCAAGRRLLKKEFRRAISGCRLPTK